MKVSQRIFAASIGLLLGVCVAAAQQAPTENKGVKMEALTAYELGAQGLDDFKSRKFRMRQVTIEPGGVVAAHSHRDRPGIAYIVKGAIVEHREGSPAHEYKAGDVITESTNVSHWVENKSAEPAVIVAVDLFKE